MSLEEALERRRQEATGAMTALHQYRATLETDSAAQRAFDAAVQPVCLMLSEALNLCDALAEMLTEVREGYTPAKDDNDDDTD